jgi:recombination protein RecR
VLDAQLPGPLRELIERFTALPGVGAKTATRYAMYLLRSHPGTAAALAAAIGNLSDQVFECAICRNYADSHCCRYCTDPDRQDRVLCVVEDPLDLLALEQSGGYDGRYFVLHGVLSPIDGVGPTDLHLGRLGELVRERAVAEVIVATNASIEGDATASEIARQLESDGCRVTRLARGLATGGDIEFVDARTLAMALEARRPV